MSHKRIIHRQHNGFYVVYSLQTVRSFVMEDVVLLEELGAEAGATTSAAQVEELLTARIEAILAETSSVQRPQAPPLPLVRLRVDYSGDFQPPNTQRFGQRFIDRLANPRDLLLLHRRRERSTLSDSNFTVSENQVPVGHEATAGAILNSTGMLEMVARNIEADEALRMVVLTEVGMGIAVCNYVEKDRHDAVSDVVQHQFDK